MSHRTKKMRDSETLKNLERESFHILNRYNLETFLLSENIFLWATQFILFEYGQLPLKKVYSNIFTVSKQILYILCYIIISYIYILLYYILFIYLYYIYIYIIS